MQRRIEKPVKYLRWNFSRNFLTTSKYSDIWQGFEYDSGKWDFVWSLYTYTQKCTDVMNIWGCNDYEDVLSLHIVIMWRVSQCEVFSGPYFPVFGINIKIYGVNPNTGNQNSMWIWKNADQKILCIWTIFT